MFHQAFQYLSFMILISFTLSDGSNNVCFTRKIRSSECICENLLMTDHPDPEIVSKLTCTNGDALQAAIEAKKSRNDLLFVNIQITGGTLESIRHRDLKSFQAVEDLILSDNKISFIEADAFKGQKNLRVLDLSFNHLPALQDFSFKHLFHLKNLSVSDNQLHSIETNSFNDLHNLLYLDLSRNNLSFLDNSFAPLKNLQYLILSHNEINVIANNSFSSLVHLLRLDLSFNQLKVIPSTLFYRLKNLNFLSLAGNKLETLEENTFKGNNLLDKVNLTGKSELHYKFDYNWYKSLI